LVAERGDSGEGVPSTRKGFSIRERRGGFEGKGTLSLVGESLWKRKKALSGGTFSTRRALKGGGEVSPQITGKSIRGIWKGEEDFVF